MKRTLVLLGFACSTWIGWSTPSFADVVDAPPELCPNGSEGSTCHGGPHCRPRYCTSDADCTEGRTCKDTKLCTSKINCGGLIEPDADPSQYESDKVVGFCSDDDTCSGGATCKTLKVCVGASASTSTGASSGGGEEIGGCSCGVPGATGGAAAGALSLAALAAVSLLRSRRQRDSRQRRA